MGTLGVMRGSGRVFRRKGSSRWWIAYYHGGREIREPGGASEAEAKAKLKQRLSEIAGERFLGPAQERVTVNELLDDLLLHLTNKGARGVDKDKAHMRALREFFGTRRALDVTTALIERFQAERLAAGRAPATVNRELEELRHAYRLASTRSPKKVSPGRVPLVPMLKVQNARQGFLARADFEAILAGIKDADLRDFVEWNFWTGMRPGETAQLAWSGFDRETWTLRLHARQAKIGRGRTLALEGPTRAILERRLTARRLDCALIFHRTSKGKAGQPIDDYRRSWAAACQAAGLPAGRFAPGGLIPYDLRRTAIRNMVRAGVSPTVAKRVSGHLTDATFERYNIVDEEDLRLAMRLTAEYVSALPRDRKVLPMAAAQGREHGQNTDSPQDRASGAVAGSVGYGGWMAEAGGNRRQKEPETPDHAGPPDADDTGT